MLKRGWCFLMRLNSRKSASTSLRTAIHSTVSAACTIWRVRSDEAGRRSTTSPGCGGSWPSRRRCTRPARVLELVRARRVGDRARAPAVALPHCRAAAVADRTGWVAGAICSWSAGLEFRRTYRFRGRQPRGGRPGCPRRPRAEPHTPRGHPHAATAGSAAGPLHPRDARRARRRGSPRPRPTLGDRLLILGHHYQRDEVIKWADARGDSFKLARFAADNDQATDIVFCGVHFMAESADVLTGDHQRVILPDLNAGCSMADMADIDQVEECWDALRRRHRHRPGRARSPT